MRGRLDATWACCKKRCVYMRVRVTVWRHLMWHNCWLVPFASTLRRMFWAARIAFRANVWCDIECFVWHYTYDIGVVLYIVDISATVAKTMKMQWYDITTPRELSCDIFQRFHSYTSFHRFKQKKCSGKLTQLCKMYTLPEFSKLSTFQSLRVLISSPSFQLGSLES